MALWDLRGKALELSVSELMGGRYAEQVPCYATGMYFKEMSEADLIASILDEAAGYQQQGFTALKIKVGKNLPFDIRQIEAIRNRLPEMDMMADSNHAYDLPEAIQMGHVLSEHDFRWFEEPLSPELGNRGPHDRSLATLPLPTFLRSSHGGILG